MIGTIKEREEELKGLYPSWDGYTLWSFFKKNSERFGERDFVVDDNQTYTYGQVRQLADQAARGFFACGIRPGSHVAVRLKNRIEYIVSIFALAKLRCVKVSVHMKISETELDYVLRQSDSEFLIAEENVSSHVVLRSGLKACILLSPDKKKENSALSWKEIRELAETIEEKDLEKILKEKEDPSSLCDIMFTSGSTSWPKGVILTHDMLVRSAFATVNTRHMEVGRRISLPIPLFHAMAYVEGLLSALTVGGAVLISAQKNDPDRILDQMQIHKANDVVCVSSVMVHLLIRAVKRDRSFPHMHAAYWAASCPDWVWDKAKKFFGITDIGTGYGMTECGSTSHIMGPGDCLDPVNLCHGRLKAAGTAAFPKEAGHLLEMKLQNTETKEECGPGQAGEIMIRGISVTPGYYKDPKATKEAVDEEGWFHTGDLGRRDERGYLTFLGRSHDMYKVNGENVSPRFVEGIIGREKNVRQVEVIGISHPSCGETGVAFVEVYRNEETAVERLHDFCKRNLARFQQPEFIFIMEPTDWPKTDTGKISKKELRKIAEEKITRGTISCQHRSY